MEQIINSVTFRDNGYNILEIEKRDTFTRICINDLIFTMDLSDLQTMKDAVDAVVTIEADEMRICGNENGFSIHRSELEELKNALDAVAEFED